MTHAIVRKFAVPAVLLLSLAVMPLAVRAQSGTPAPSPTETARNAAATWAGFGAAQQLFGAPGGDLAATAPSGTVSPSGGIIAPADMNGRLPAVPNNATPAQDDRLRNAAPAVAVDAAGHGAVVSGASIR